MATTEIAAGTVFGDQDRYCLRRLIGMGGMASVWLAEDRRLERDVAIKILSDVLALDPDFVARFEREARLAGGLSHPHLVNVFDFSTHSTRPYLVMEYLAGGTLADRLRNGLDPHWDPLVLARELLDALAHVHDAGILHRDIKPANVLIGADGRARLTDFGIAQFPETTRLTMTGLVMGTERYLPPEVRVGGAADVRSDLFACGVLLRECLGPTPPPQLHRLVALLTYDDPEQRPASARAALALLDEGAPSADPTMPFPLTPDAPLRAVPAARRPEPGPTAALAPTQAHSGPTPAQSPTPAGPATPTAGSASSGSASMEGAPMEGAAAPAEVRPTLGATAPRRRGPLLATLLVAVVTVLVVLGLVSRGGGDPEPLVVPPSDTSLSTLLDSLDDSIDRARS